MNEVNSSLVLEFEFDKIAPASGGGGGILARRLSQNPPMISISDLQAEFSFGRTDLCLLKSVKIQKRDGSDFDSEDEDDADFLSHLPSLDTSRDDDEDVDVLEDFDFDPTVVNATAFLDKFGNVVNLEYEFQFLLTTEGGATATKDAKAIIKICGDETLTSASPEDLDF